MFFRILLSTRLFINNNSTLFYFSALSNYFVAHAFLNKLKLSSP
jgi:hypothetical protein